MSSLSFISGTNSFDSWFNTCLINHDWTSYWEVKPVLLQVCPWAIAMYSHFANADRHGILETRSQTFIFKPPWSSGIWMLNISWKYLGRARVVSIHPMCWKAFRTFGISPSDRIRLIEEWQNNAKHSMDRNPSNVRFGYRAVIFL